MQITSFGEIVWIGIIAGLIGTAGMTLFLTIVTKSGIAHADMVRSVGSLFTRSLDNSYKTGIIIHTGWGIFFGIIYTFIISNFNLSSIFLIISVGFLIGFIHGFAVSLLLVIAVAEHHPVEQFRTPGFAVAVAHFVAHLIYGTLVGIVASIMG